MFNTAVILEDVRSQLCKIEFLNNSVKLKISQQKYFKISEECLLLIASGILETTQAVELIYFGVLCLGI